MLTDRSSRTQQTYGPPAPPAVRTEVARTSDVPLARALVRRTLDSWCLAGTVEDAELVVTELLANALARSAPPVVLTLRRRGPFPGTATGLRIEVSDADPALPRFALPGPDACEHNGSFPDPAHENGRGLALVAALSTRVGGTITDHGKTVWAELAVS